jgi:hypothetical protein
MSKLAKDVGQHSSQSVTAGVISKYQSPERIDSERVEYDFSKSTKETLFLLSLIQFNSTFFTKEVKYCSFILTLPFFPSLVRHESQERNACTCGGKSDVLD